MSESKNTRNDTNSVFVHHIPDIFDNAPVGVFTTTPEGRIISANGALSRMFGYESPQEMTASVTDIAAQVYADPADREELIRLLEEHGEVSDYQCRFRHRDGTGLWGSMNVRAIQDEDGRIKAYQGFTTDITKQKTAEEKLERLEWMVSGKSISDIEFETQTHDQGYGDLTELNRDGMILTSIGRQNLESFVNDFLELLGTSSAVYEANGDYALGIFTSGWCRMMDSASRRLCRTPDNAEALESGRWLCHESCWTDCSRRAIAECAPVDIACNGGIRMYAVPILANGTVVGAINIGYGDPPKDPEKLRKIAEAYHIDYDDLVQKADAYDSRPSFIIELAKKRLHATARLIGSMVETKQAEEELKKSEETLRTTLHSIGDAVISSDMDGLVAAMNPVADSLTGWSRKEAIGRPMETVFRIINEQTRQPVESPVTNVLKSGHTVGLANHTLLIAKDGREIPIADSGAPIRNDAGEITGVVLVFRDQTEERAVREAVEESERRFQRMLGVVPDMISIQNPEMDILYSNWHGFAAVPENRRILHTKCHKTYRNLDDLCPDCLAQSVLENRKPIHEEAQLPDGKWVDIRVLPILDKDNHVEMFMEWVRDITERKQREELLKEKKELLEAIYRNAPLIMMVVNAERRIQQINGFAEQFANRDAEEMLGLRGGEALRCLHVLDDPRGCGFGDLCRQCVIRNTVLDTLETGKTHMQVETPYYFKGLDNETREFEFLMSTAPIEIKGEQMVLVTLQDITDSRQAEQEKEKLQAQLLQAQKMESVGRLAGGVAHDFNNMLGVVLGHTEMALENVDPKDPLFTDLQEVRKTAERSANLTRQLLTFARKQTIEPKVIDLNETVEGMLKMLGRLIGEDIDLSWVPGKNIAPVKMDPSQIDQILANLCVNARDAIADVGKVTIETGLAAFDQAYCDVHAGFVPGEYVMLAVSDNGCGMDQETVSHLFEPFFTTKDVGKGTGLGLATVYGAVKQNKGFINVYSEPGQGTTFRIYLPPYQAGTRLRADTATPKPAARGSETILLVEDEPANLHMVTMMLEKLGYDVIAAETPGEAIRLAHEHAGSIDLLMTDVVMPEMNGRDLAKNILPIYPDIKRLFMSGYTANVIAHHGVLDEGVHFIQKPFSSKDLGAKLRDVLES